MRDHRTEFRVSVMCRLLKQISYHTKDAWHDGYFKSYPRAQEYVVVPTEGVIQWARRLIEIGTE